VEKEKFSNSNDIIHSDKLDIIDFKFSIFELNWKAFCLEIVEILPKIADLFAVAGGIFYRL